MPHEPVPTTSLAREPIAIIGMAGRFADATDLRDLWNKLRGEHDGIREIPPERYDVDAVYDPTPRTPGRTVSRWGGLLEDVKSFDSEFFGISPREADRMDPQQRLLLEVSYEALEDAGQPLDRLAGSDTGVFVGQLGGDYWHLQYRNRDQLDLYGLTGAASRAVTSGRLSYAFDLRGPSFTVDTACSSALVAVHNAIQALRLGECTMAIAGGVNIVLLPEEGVVYSGAGMLAGDGRCKFGDASGDGFVRSDGIGSIILKPLSTALADGDRIRAVLKGSAIGNDGQSSGYLVTPGVEGQRDVLRRAYADAGIDPSNVDYIEAHGTGTRVGDPVELQAIADVVGQRPEHDRLMVGSIKTNIGHTEAAAGIAGLIKAVMCLEHREVPASLHLRNPNPAVDWDRLPLRIPTRTTALPERQRPSLAGVSSFGFSGTNAHLVLEAAPSTQPLASQERQTERTELLTLSAHSPEALAEAAGRMARLLAESDNEFTLRDLCYSAATRRTLHESRLAVPVDSRDEAAEILTSFADGHEEAGLSYTEYTSPDTRSRIAFVFPGQGSQWVGMGQQLLGTESVFLAAMERCDKAIHTETGWSVLELLSSDDETRFNELDVIQPTLWAMEIALAELWRSWGLEPDIVIGHSMGESAAAYIAGALSLEDAAAVICRRSRLAKRLSGNGTMAWVAMPADEATRALEGFEDQVAVAAMNSPTSTLLSGHGNAIAEVLAILDERGVDNRRVNVDFASHCPQMDALRPDLLSELAHITPRAGSIPLHSTLLDSVIDGSEMNADYWARNIRQPVDFIGAVRSQLSAEGTAFVEVSPHPLLVNSIREIAQVAGQKAIAVGSLRRQRDERSSLLAHAAALHTSGLKLDLNTMTGPAGFVALPTYPWQGAPHWIDVAVEPTPPVSAPPTPAAHPLLGEEMGEEDPGRVWQGPLDLHSNTYLRDHLIQGTIILPGTAHLELISAAARRHLGQDALALSDVRYHRALFLDESTAPPQVRVTTAPAAGGRLKCKVYSQDPNTKSGEWQLHTESVASPLTSEVGPPEDSLGEIRSRCPEHQTSRAFYDWNAARGNQWNGSFQGIDELWRADGEVLAHLRCPNELLDHMSQHHFHPALLDAAGHTMAAARPATVPGEEGVFVLGGIQEARFYRSPSASMYSHALLVSSDRKDSFTADIDIRDDAGNLLAQMIGLRLQYLAGESPEPLTPDREAQDMAVDTPPIRTVSDGPESWLHTLTWEDAPQPVPPVAETAAGYWLVLTDSGPTGRRLIRELTDRGERVVAVTAAAGGPAGGTDRYRIDASRPEHYSHVLSGIADQGNCRGVLHLWALDAQPGIGATETALHRAQILGGHSLLHLTRALEKQPLRGAPLWLLTQHAQSTGPQDPVRNPFQAPMWGLGRTLAAEAPGLSPRMVDLDRTLESIATLVDHLLSPDREDQIALRAGRRHVARLRRLPALTAPRALSQRAPGVLDDLVLTSTARSPLEIDQVRIRVEHSGLNYRDVLQSLGMYPGQGDQIPVMGWECSGTVVEIGHAVTDVEVGDEVIALAEACLADEVITKALLTAPRPAHLTSAQAATLPISYLTAYHSLHHLAQVTEGDKVLIHSATGGTGLAALHVARWKGANVYATAGSGSKRQMLADLGIDHVADSRTLAFADEFRPANRDEGFAAILNTLTGPAIAANLSLMAPYGHYLELSKKDILDDSPLPMNSFDHNLSFHAVDVVHMIQKAPERAGRLLREVTALVDQGALPPLPETNYPAREAALAFRDMARAKHTGKLVLTFQGGTTAPAVVASPTPTPSVHEHGTYLVTGGAGGIGAQLALWLAEQGARHLLLTGRSLLPRTRSELAENDPRATAVSVIEELGKRGVEVEYASVDVSDRSAMEHLLREHRRSGRPPLRGVFHAAGAIDYNLLSDTDTDEFDALQAAKVSGTWNLHRLLVGEEIDTFVMFSSGSSLLSSPTLGSYAAANAFLDALAHQRIAAGLPATSINWGFWDQVGMVARREQEDERSLRPHGMHSFSPEDGFGILKRVMDEGVSHIAVLRADWPEWATAYPTAAASPMLTPLTATERDSEQAPAPAAPSAPTVKNSHTTPVAAEPRPTAPPVPLAEVPDVVRGDELVRFVTGEVAAVLGLREERVNVSRPLNRLGMDSLMAVELRNRVERRFGVKLPMVRLLKDGTVATVAQALNEELEPESTANTRSLPSPRQAARTTARAPQPMTPGGAQASSQRTPAVDDEHPTADPSQRLGSSLAEVPDVVRGDELVRFVTGEVAAVLGLREERVNVSRPLNRLGMDSLMAVELRNRVERRFGVKLPMVRLLKDGTVATVAQALNEELENTHTPA